VKMEIDEADGFVFIIFAREQFIDPELKANSIEKCSSRKKSKKSVRGALINQ
jgi:hypothetical protein